MELVDGVSFQGWLDVNQRMPLEQFVPFFERVALAVEATHDRGILHRDLKPSNLMVVMVGDNMIPKLLDFGIAKVLHALDAIVTPGAMTALGSGSRAEDVRLTASGAILGSPA